MVKKTKNIYEEHKVVFNIIFLFIFVLFMASSKYLFFNEGAIQFSCIDEKISGYVLTNPPPFCIACTSDCYVEMSVIYEEDQICQNGGKGSGSATLECKDLNKYIGKEVLVKYNLSYANITLKNVEEKLKIETK